jgi:hypothetical protein
MIDGVRPSCLCAQSEHLLVMHAHMDAMHSQQVRAAIAIEQSAQSMQQLHAAAGILDHKLSESVANGVRAHKFRMQLHWGTEQRTVARCMGGCRKA